MYLDFFGLEREPFHITPDPEFLFPSPSHKEAFATVMYGVQQQKGFVVVTGEVGTGKTTVLRAYLQKLKGSDIQPIYLFDPHLAFDELLEAILTELGAPRDAGETQFSRLQWLRHYLIDAYSTGRSVVLIVDEAQNMPVGTLEQLRVLTNLETTKDKLLQVLLVGQPELEEKLALHQLRQLSQRVAVRATLRALSNEEASDYVKHRVRQAGGIPENIFTTGALKAIVAHAKGNPRVLNITCDNILINAFGANQSSITPALVKRVIRELQPVHTKRPVDWRQYTPMATAAGLTVMVGLSAWALLRDTPGAEASVPGAAAPVAAASTAAGEAHEAKVVPVQPKSSAADVVSEPIKEEAVEAPAVTPVTAPETQEAGEPVEALATAAVPAPEATRPEAVKSEAPVATAVMPDAPAAEGVEAEVANVTPAAKAEEQPPAAAPPKPVEAIKEPVAAPDVKTAQLEETPPVAAVPDHAAPEPTVQAEPALKKATSPETAKAEAPAKREKVDGLAKSPAPATAPAEAALASLEASRDPRGRLERKVEKGDKLILLLEEVYGRSDDKLIQKVQAENPKITDPNLILAGENLVFPEVNKSAEKAAAGASPAPAN